MEPQTYHIDKTQLNKLRNKTIKRGLIAVIPSLLIVIFLQYRQDGNASLLPSFASLFITIPVVLIPLYIGGNRAKRSYNTMEIVLSDAGIERKAEAWPYKRISWKSAVITEKPDGMIVVDDKNVSKFKRWMFGTGRLFIQPEIADRDKLMAELYQRGLNISQ